jgi:predicted dinucleotide-binding enzyme
MKIAFLGGGNFASNLGELLARAGHDVVLGLRDVSRKRPPASYAICSLQDAAIHGDVIVLAVPYQACDNLLSKLSPLLAGKIVVDATNPLDENWAPLFLGQKSSAAEEIAKILPSSRLVKAFNTIFADIMQIKRLDRDGHPITAFIAGHDDDANHVAIQIATSAGFAPLLVGDLENSRYLEAMAHLNIQIAVTLRGGTNAAFIYHQAIQ